MKFEFKGKTENNKCIIECFYNKLYIRGKGWMNKTKRSSLWKSTNWWIKLVLDLLGPFTSVILTLTSGQNLLNK